MILSRPAGPAAGHRFMSIQIDEANRIFKLDTARSSYLFHVDENGYPAHLYYGGRISDLKDTPALLGQCRGGSSFCAPHAENAVNPLRSWNLTKQEYTTNAIGDYRISSVAVRNPDGTSCTDPRYSSYRVIPGKPRLRGLPASYANEEEEVDTLEVILKDSVSRVEFILSYSVFAEKDVIARSVRIVNRSETCVVLEKAMSLCLDLPEMEYDLLQLSGCYARERYVERNPLRPGLQGMGSVRTSSSHNHNPAFALVSPRAGESSGEVYGFLFVYSGSWLAEIEADSRSQTRICLGIHPDCFEWTLEPGEEFQTPEALLSFSAQGLERMSLNFHRLIRENLIPEKWKRTPRPILVNNWEATYFDFNEEKLLRIARDAADLGIEMLVLDDGWFGHRENDRSSLGDWFVNESKIGRLPELVKKIRTMGLKFGLWFEPEMVSEDSELFRTHPEWTLTVPGRNRSLGRTQMVLDMSRKEVVDYLFEKISSILKSAEVSYIKWDMNRQPAEMSSPSLPPARQKELSHRFVLGVYELHRRLLEAFPDLMIEGCSGGGGRFDAGILFYAPQIWCSDNTDAMERLKIQSGTSFFYPPSCIGAHLSVCPNHATRRTTPFRTRGLVALAGTFGYELDLNVLSAEERKLVREQVALYHKYHHLVDHGNLHRLLSPFDDQNSCCAETAWEFSAEDASEAILIYVVPSLSLGRGIRYLRLRGLDPSARYRIEGSELSEGADSLYSGDTLMNAGIPMPAPVCDGDGVLIHFIRVSA